MSIAVQGPTRVSVEIGGQEISFETGKLAKQADGAVVVRSGDTMVLSTAQGRMEAREGADFFPLTVDVEERMYAAGKIPGGFFKREGRPTERAILTARMIDRPIRPLWPKGYKNEVQVICTVLSADMVTPHDILCINGASAALMVEAILKDQKKIMPCSVFLQGEYGIHDLFVGVPVKLGANGVEQIMMADLDAAEQAALHKSAGAVKELVDIIKV